MAAGSDTYCVLPFIQLSVHSTGSVKACCVSQGNLQKPDGAAYNVGREGLEEIWNSPPLTELRSDLLAGRKAEVCKRCWTDERLGLESKRMRDNARWKERIGQPEPTASPLWMDLRLGNLCNLKCRICNPYSSAKFGKEAAEMFNDFDFDKLQDETRWAEQQDSTFWQKLNEWLGTVEHFDIYGGEPFLSKPHFALLERSVRAGYSKKQSLHYNTNGTIFPERMAEEVWPNFKSVNVMFSIDGVGKQFEYQRHPAKWDQVEENIRRFKKYKNLNLNICFTVNVMNIWDLPEFYDWARKMKLKFWINYLYEPRHFRAQIFSDEAKRRIEERLRKLPKDLDFRHQILPLIGFLWDHKFSDSDRVYARAQLEIYDRARGECFREVFPEAYDLLMLDENAVPPLRKPTVFNLYNLIR